eukprot:TRINITY_DN7_c0_g1_i25.p2 TRINITY_DN7_c0_g1~~TRINITY_DN7_c0_g1_i25.p2  ORF type:complete len:105 (+),score=6.75 TRINITY_DN7_c0_g1_i25:165-479(+)
MCIRDRYQRRVRDSHFLNMSLYPYNRGYGYPAAYGYGGEEHPHRPPAPRDGGEHPPRADGPPPPGGEKNCEGEGKALKAVSFTHLPAHATPQHPLCRPFLYKKK